MKEKQNRLLNAVYDHFGVTDKKVRAALSAAVQEHLEKDREYFVVLRKEGQGLFPEVSQGRPCKLVPLARFTGERCCDGDRTIRLGTLYLMVTQQRVRLVHAIASVVFYEGGTPNFFFPEHTAISPFHIPDKLKLLSPGEIAEVTSALDRKYYAMAFYAHSKMYREEELEQIPQKTERTMFALCNTPAETYRMESGETVTGVLVPVGVDHEAKAEKELADRLVYTEVEFCLLRTEADVRYVLRTTETTRFVVDEDDADLSTRQYGGLEEQYIYRFAALSDITEGMYSYY